MLRDGRFAGERRSRRPCRASSPRGSTRCRRRRSCSSRTRRSSARCSGRARSRRSAATPAGRSRSGCTRSSARSSSAASGAARWRARASTRSVTCSCATWRTRRSRAPRARTSIASRPSGSSRSAPAAPRIGRRCSRTTTRPRSSSRARRVRTTDELEARARLAFRDAGERALALSAIPAALQFFANALELWPEEDDATGRPSSFARPRRTCRSGSAANSRSSARALERMLARGDVENAAEAEAAPRRVRLVRGEERLDVQPAGACARARRRPPCVALEGEDLRGAVALPHARRPERRGRRGRSREPSPSRRSSACASCRQTR